MSAPPSNLVFGKTNIASTFPNTGVCWAIDQPVSFFYPIWAGVNPATGDARWYTPNADPSKIAEAKVLRAFFYYLLIDDFGDVPFYTDNNITVDKIPQASRQEVRPQAHRLRDQRHAPGCRCQSRLHQPRRSGSPRHPARRDDQASTLEGCRSGTCRHPTNHG